MPRYFQKVKDTNKYAIWTTVSDGYVTDELTLKEAYEYIEQEVKFRNLCVCEQKALYQQLLEAVIYGKPKVLADRERLSVPSSS